MDSDDIIYLFLLMFSILFGYIYRMIEVPSQRKIVGTSIGFLLVFFVSGIHALHLVVCVIFNSIIILYISKKWCHIISFFCSFSYLFFFRTTEYFGIPYPPAHTNLIQMILTLKLVGLAFECNTAAMQSKNESIVKKLEMNIAEIFHYSFNYVGILTGPYYSYNTYFDFIHKPFWKYAKCKNATIEKLKFVPIFAVLFLIITKIWPLSYAFTDEFYEERSWLYRFWYTTPTFFWFRMRIYIGLTLSECVCTAAGLGAYPVQADAKPGLGPSTDLSIMKIDYKNCEYDFKTVYNIDSYSADFCITFREGMKHWNMCVQYWLAVNVYKRFPIKAMRTLVTMFVSAVWHGVYVGHYFCLCMAPFYLVLEDLYVKEFRKNADGFKAKVWDWILWIFKMQGFGYLGMAFQLLTVKYVLKYYGSIYHAGLLLGVFLYVVGLLVSKVQKKKTV